MFNGALNTPLSFQVYLSSSFASTRTSITFHLLRGENSVEAQTKQ